MKVPRASPILQRVCKALGLVDIWRIINPSSRDYTFISPVHKMYRLDFFLISKALASSAVSCETGSIVISDHAWVGSDLLPQSERRHQGISRDQLAICVTPWCGMGGSVIRGRIIQYTSFSKKG